MHAALRKDRAYLPLAVTPFLFGAQQLCEAGVWIGLDWGDPGLVRTAALVFLFFGIAFWPGWVPFGTAVLETSPRKRRLFLALAAVGLVIGCGFYMPMALHYGDWLEVSRAGHSIRYDLEPVMHSVRRRLERGGG